MAHLQKFSSGGKAVMRHNSREHLTYSNEQIDGTRTHLNYNLVQSDLTQEELLAKRLSEVKVLKRKDVVQYANWCFTLPKETKKEHEKFFFRVAHAFCEHRYGKENIIAAHVHYDETTPHLHLSVIPVVEIEKEKQKEFTHKLSAKECFDKNDLQTFHTDFQKQIDRNFMHHFGYTVAVVNDDKKKVDEKFLDKIEFLQKLDAEISEKKAFLELSVDGYTKYRLESLEAENEQLHAENEQLQSVLQEIEEDYDVLSEKNKEKLQSVSCLIEKEEYTL